MKKILLALVLVSLFALPAVSLANHGPTHPQVIPAGPTSQQALLDLIDKVANWIFSLLLAVALIFILIAAFQFLTSGGSPETVAKARQTLLYAVIGIAVAFLARGFVAIVRVVINQ